jgi:uncharacterized protein VirK/YbjX
MNSQSYYRSFFQAAKNVHPEKTIRSFKNIANFLFCAYKNKSEICIFLERIKQVKNPNFKLDDKKLGVIEWPYIHNSWDIDHKLNVMAGHYEFMAYAYPRLVLDRNNAIYNVIDLDAISKDVSIVIDIAPWFLREGELVINIFRQDLRVASMAFAICIINNENIAYIGAVQGIHSGVSAEESLEIFRILTKDFEGLRPRSLMLEVLKIIFDKLGVQKIYAISEQHRHHRHPYFGNSQETVFKSDYNAFWEEHGGIFNDGNGFYSLPLNLAIKDLSTIASKKRSLYKRRYEMIESIKDNITQNMKINNLK